MLHGEAFERWLMSEEWATIPDFLNMPDDPVNGQLCKRDYQVLRRIVGGYASGKSSVEQAAMRRLRNHGIVGHARDDAGSFFTMTDFTRAVMKANSSFRACVLPAEKDNA